MTDFTAKQVCTALYRHWAPSWCVLFELSASPPFDKERDWKLGVQDHERQRRIDVLALRKPRARYTGDGWERLAVEVKVARGDFLADVRDPHKQALWRSITHAFAYAAPAGLISIDELPEGAGLIEIGTSDLYGGAHVSWKRKAVWCPAAIGPLPPRVLNAITYRASRAEAASRGYAWSTSNADPEEMRLELDRLRHELQLAFNKAEAERALRVQWQERYAAVGDPPCGTCGQPLRISRSRRHHGWEHRPADAQACEDQRRTLAEAEERTRQAALPEERRYASTHLYVPPPFPAERLDGAA